MTMRNTAIGLAMFAAAAVALPEAGVAEHEHWFYDSYQAHEHQAYPNGYYRPPQQGRWVRPYSRYAPPPAYQPPLRRWFPAAPPRYWFPPTEPPQRWRPSPPRRDQREVYETRRQVKPPIPQSKPDAPQVAEPRSAESQSEVAARRAPAASSGAEQRPADADIVTGTVPEVTSRNEPRAAESDSRRRVDEPDVAATDADEPDSAATNADEPEIAATSAPEERSRGEQRSARSGDGISCEAAADIIGEFGFSDVRAKGCDGQVYNFEATRDGQGYSIKLSAADGELTEVRKH